MARPCVTSQSHPADCQHADQLPDKQAAQQAVFKCMQWCCLAAGDGSGSGSGGGLHYSRFYCVLLCAVSHQTASMPIACQTSKQSGQQLAGQLDRLCKIYRHFFYM